jgi:hypothetical protein
LIGFQEQFTFSLLENIKVALSVVEGRLFVVAQLKS